MSSNTDMSISHRLTVISNLKCPPYLLPSGLISETPHPPLLHEDFSENITSSFLVRGKSNTQKMELIVGTFFAMFC